MGVDWVPARPRPGADPGGLRELRELIAQQAALAYPLFSPDSPADIPVRAARAAYGAVDERVSTLLDFPVAEDGSWPCFRVLVIGGNPLLPPEWRRAAYATLLPDDAARTVARWRAWYAEVTAGRMLHYRRRLAAWDAARLLRETQGFLVGQAAQAGARQNAWTRADRFQSAYQQIQSLPQPPPVAYPGPPPATDAGDAPAPGQEEQIAALVAHVGLVCEAVQAFNRCVPGGLRARPPRPVPEPGAGDRDAWLEEFLAWAAPFLTSGYGLYLWA